MKTIKNITSVITLVVLLTLSAKNSIAATTNLHLTCLIEGQYNPFISAMVDEYPVIVKLHSSSSPYNVIASQTGSLDVNGNLDLAFNISTAGNYYISVHGWNIVETWSNTPLNFSINGTSNFNFTLGAVQAFGSNLRQVATKFCVFSGDVNSDGTVDLSDVIGVYNNLSTYLTGNVITDLTGDDLADADDLLFVYNNSTDFVSYIRP